MPLIISCCCLLLAGWIAPTTVYSNHGLQETPFTQKRQNTACANHSLHQATVYTNHRLHQSTVYSLHQPRLSLHQPRSTPRLIPNQALRQPPFTRNHGCHQPPLHQTTIDTKPYPTCFPIICQASSAVAACWLPTTFYTNHGLHQTRLIPNHALHQPTTAYTKPRFTPNLFSHNVPGVLRCCCLLDTAYRLLLLLLLLLGVCSPNSVDTLRGSYGKG